MEFAQLLANPRVYQRPRRCNRRGKLENSLRNDFTNAATASDLTADNESCEKINSISEAIIQSAIDFKSTTAVSVARLGVPRGGVRGGVAFNTISSSSETSSS
ncbi:hypothetical protein ACJIZ3_017965 [Penstemon smallii]|uniref:Uncharacterized protein n=1 Tax=Penstemon smallii TaxID=265156 RepID=A0ABD3SXI8_9LAMI